MNKQGNSYKKGNDVSVLSLCTHERLIINPQISPTKLTDSEGVHRGPSELILVFSAADPVPVEEREEWQVDPNIPLIVVLESKDQIDKLIAVLQKLRFQVYGPDLSFDKIIN
jgi:hypothetical protein